MRNFMIIAQKELIELLRDRKTIIYSILLPTVLLPLLLIVSLKMKSVITNKDKNEVAKIGIVDAPKEFIKLAEKDSLNQLFYFTSNSNFKLEIESDSIHAIIVFPGSWKDDMTNLSTSSIKVYQKSGQSNMNQRITKFLDQYKNQVKENRLNLFNVPIEKLTPFQVDLVEFGSEKEGIGRIIGGFIPFLFISTMLMGCLMACIDMLAGEKERKTIETTLSLPISKFDVLTGKMLVGSLVGFIPTVISLIGLIVIGLIFTESIPEELRSLLSEMFNIQSISMILLLLIPFSLFLSGAIIFLIAGANSYKEAQSRSTPVLFLVLIPLFLAILPGAELNWTTTFIPVLNIGLSIKEIVAGTIDYGKYVVILISLSFFALISVYLSHKNFSNENSVLE